MRNIHASQLPVPFLFLAACTPATDLQNEQATAAANEATSGELSSPAVDPEAGQLDEPSPGANGIPTNLARLVVRFAEEVAPVGVAAPFLLQGGAGAAQALSLGEAVPCEGKCYQVALGTNLAASTLQTLSVQPNTLRFLDGKPVPGGSAGTFTTGADADTFVPRILAFTAQISESCVSIHLAADEAVRTQVVVSAGDIGLDLSASGLGKAFDFARRLSHLPAGEKAQVVAKVIDVAGNTTLSSPVALDLAPPLPPIVMTEVLPNPAGSETTQEWVEVYNAGSEAVALGGMVLADKTGRDLLPEASLPAGAYALIVPEKYDVASTLDTPPREGAVLLRVSGRLGSDGLANAGEPVRLLSSSGFVISQYGGWVDVSASAWSGKSVKRTGLDACDGPDAWSKTPSPPTPGW